MWLLTLLFFNAKCFLRGIFNSQQSLPFASPIISILLILYFPYLFSHSFLSDSSFVISFSNIISILIPLLFHYHFPSPDPNSSMNSITLNTHKQIKESMFLNQNPYSSKFLFFSYKSSMLKCLIFSDAVLTMVGVIWL